MHTEDNQKSKLPLGAALTFLLWSAAVFGTYFFNMLTLPGRMEKLMTLLGQVVP